MDGFLVIRTGEAQFSDIRHRVSLVRGQPYFLTSDAAIYASQLAFDELLKALEKEYLYPRLTAVTAATLDEVLSYLPAIQDPALLKDARLAAAYLAVGLNLLDPEVLPALDPETASQVRAQLDQILAGRGVEALVLQSYFSDDFSAYHPTGHYFSDPALADYYRGLTWFRRFEFGLSDRDPRFQPSKAPLIITLSLRRAATPSGAAADDWARVNDTLAFLSGSGDNFTPREYAGMMDQAYGSGVSILGLNDELKWIAFQGLAQPFPSSQAEFPLNPFLLELHRNRPWKFFSSRFTLDEVILHSLHKRLSELPGDLRKFPSGLDLMASLGSPAAIEALEQTGVKGAQPYADQLANIQTAVQSQSESQWHASAYDAWLQTLSLQLAAKSGGYPHFMQSLAWDYKELNSALGSWVLLSHGASVISRQPEIETRQQLPASPPAPAFVEPNPFYFYQLANRIEWIVEGLQSLGMTGSQQHEPFNLADSISNCLDLVDQLRWLGAIAEKELQGLPLDQEDYLLIQSPLGAVEKRALANLEPGKGVISQAQELPAIPMVAYFQAGEQKSLQVGLGYLNRIYVLVPLEDRLQIAQGGVLSYYEYFLADKELMGDGRWRRVLLNTSNFKPPAWMTSLISPEEGFPVDVTAFRVGDIYRITLQGGNLNIRESPTIGSTVFKQLTTGTYVEIIDGPVRSQGLTWWKLRTDPLSPQHLEGWSVENPEWYDRVWGN